MEPFAGLMTGTALFLCKEIFARTRGKIGETGEQKAGQQPDGYEIGLERNGKVSIGFGNKQEKHAEVDASINHFFRF